MLLVFALAFVMMMLWTEWERFSNPTPQVATTDTGQSATPTAPAADGSVPAAPAVATGQAPAAVGATPTAPVQDGEIKSDSPRIQVKTDLLLVEIDARGGDIATARLLQHARSSEELDIPFSLMKNEVDDGVLELFRSQTGLITGAGPFTDTTPAHTREYTFAQDSYELPDGQDELKIPLTYTGGDVEYTKTLTFRRDSYAVDIDYTVKNNSSETWSGFLYAQLMRTEGKSSGGFGLLSAAPSFKGGAIYTPEEKYEKVSFDDMTDEVLSRKVDSGWVAMLQHYFVGAFLPKAGQPMEFYTTAFANTAPQRYAIGYKTLSPVNVEGGSTGNLSTRLFVGPKERDHLLRESEGLPLTVDYGWLTIISEPLFWVLNKIHSVVGNWGWAIILLTCLIKLIFFPLSAASYKSMARMKKMQPRLATLKERYGDDRARLNQEMMQLYKTEKINPLGGCLPILIQIPVFIALYWVLLESVELRQAPWMLWIKDLSIKDPFYVLPIIMGASMIFQQILNPAPVDPIQKNIMMALPVVFTFLFLFFPAGLVLYWVVNNCLSIAQQWYITRKIVK